MKAEAIVGALLEVTKDWAKTRKQEERDESRLWRRHEYLTRPLRETIKDVASEVMAAAYLKASAGGTLPAHARQIMYAARGAIQARTGRTLDDQYFCQTLLPDYITAHPEAAAWDVVFDARGHFTEPHTARIVPLGTIDVRRYLQDIGAHRVTDPTLALSDRDRRYPTCGPGHRYGAILFIEKEGFMPLFERVQLRERYDVAIMSTKGLSVTACRELVNTLCNTDAEQGAVPLLVLHDFDKAGFSILGTLQRDTRRYAFANPVRVIDLGLRLADVQTHQLEAEDVAYGRSDPHRNLRDNGATEEEIRFLCATSDARGYAGQRIELNAFPSDQLVTWIEGKLRAHGVQKVVPSEADLRTAYRRALEVALLGARVAAIADEVHRLATRAPIPKGLGRLVRQRLEGEAAVPWDAVLADLAESAAEDDPEPERAC